SNDEGRYLLANLGLGNYEIAASLPGFQTAVRTGIEITIDRRAVLNFTLTVGSISERVTVTGDAPLVETTSASVANLVDSQQIRDLPLNGRDFIQLAALQEGVVIAPLASHQAGDSGIKLIISGTRPSSTGILLDGTDIKNNQGNTPGGLSGSLLGVDTIAEFRVITNVYSAEYGRFTGGIVTAVTRSGSNDLHGSVFAFHRNSALDARNFFDRDPDNPLERSDPPGFKRNQFGFTLGGPIVKDQTFFFGSYEGLRERLGLTTTYNFPNQNMRDGLIPRSRGQCPSGSVPQGSLCFIDVPDTVQPYLDLYPLPNGPDNGDGGGQFIAANPRPLDEDYFVVKIDHQFSDSDSFFARYTFDDSILSADAQFIYNNISTTRNQYLTLEEKHIFSPNLLNEIRVAYNRSRSDDEDLVDSTFPAIDPALFFHKGRNGLVGTINADRVVLSSMGATSRRPQFHTQNLFQYMDNVVWTTGNHALKMGVSASRFQYNQSSVSRTNGRFDFQNIATFMQGIVRNASTRVTSPWVAGLRQWLVGLYIQDDFQLSPNLSINLGLRYEFVNSPTEVSDRVANISDPLQEVPDEGGAYFTNPSLKNFSPRVGFAWDPTGSGKTSIRGGFGLFHDQLLPWVYTFAPFRMRPFALRITLEDPTPMPFPNVLDDLVAFHEATGTLPPEILNSTAANAVTDPSQPYIMQWNFSIQQEILPGTAVTVTYAGSRGVHLSRTADVNVPPGVLLSDGRRFFDSNTPEGTVRPNPTFSSITDRRWDGMSWYNGLKLGLRKRFSSGFQYQIAYNWQKFMDEGSAIRTTGGDFTNASTFATDWRDHKIDRGLSAYHVAHTFSSNFTFELPFGPGRSYGSGTSGVAAALIQGWQINGIISLSSGQALGINGDGSVTCGLCAERGAASRPDLISGKDNSPNTGDPTAWFGSVTDNFEEQERGFYGNLGRNTAEAPGLATFDLAINKSFALGERADLQFRTEFFNLFNRANFGAPALATFSRGRASGSFGRITTTNGTSRHIHFAFKIVF
ncbi:MAG: TonB-dependent receptor, partial [Spirochaetia bacterium]